MDILNYHQKQVTAITYYANEQAEKKRVLTSSLDGAVKVIDPVSFKVVHNFKFPDPILSVAVSVWFVDFIHSQPSNILAVGTTTGIVSTRIRQEVSFSKEFHL